MPAKNLITEKQNDIFYYKRLADEFIRYSRIKKFMFMPQLFLSFSNVPYNLRENEIILNQSTLTQEYFENLIPAVQNKYAKFVSYDMAQPANEQPYDNVFDTNSEKHKHKAECEYQFVNGVKSVFWSKVFPATFGEKQYGEYIACTYQIVIDIINEHKKMTDTDEKEQLPIPANTNDIKRLLLDAYKPYLSAYRDKIISILIGEGKKTHGTQVREGTMSFANFIYMDNYYLTPLDFWVLFDMYKIPVMFISSKPIKLANNDAKAFVAYGSRSDTMAFIMLPSLEGTNVSNIPRYRSIVDDMKSSFIDLEDLSGENKGIVYNAINEKLSVDEYLKIYDGTAVIKPKKKHIVIVDEEDEEEIIVVKKPPPKLTRKYKKHIASPKSKSKSKSKSMSSHSSTKRAKVTHVDAETVYCVKKQSGYCSKSDKADETSSQCKYDQATGRCKANK